VSSKKDRPDMQEMEAVILCGGLGTRLREETQTRPKPMLEIGTRPILWHIMRIYASFGVRNFILCLGYRGDVIRDYFLHYRLRSANFTLSLGTGQIDVEKDIADDDWNVTLLETGSETGTGGRILQALEKVRNSTFFATYGDGVSSIDLTALYGHHNATRALGTVTSVHPPARFGEIQVENGLVKAFSEKPQTASGSINGGFFVFEKEAFKGFPRDPSVSLENDILPQLSERAVLAAYQHDGFWQCMDTPREMLLLNEIWSRGKAPWQMDDK